MLTNDSQMLTIGIVVATNVPMRVSPATPARTMAVLANAALIEKARRLCFQAW
jgi:hypothetical protein